MLLSAAVVMRAEDDIDRTDFSDPALKEDIEEGPSQHVVSASLLPDAIENKIEIGANNTLLVSLSNLGGKMYNVTYIDGHLETVSTAERLGNFRRQSYGDALGPREQRSFRYLFVPPTSLKPGEYRLTCAIHYQNRDMARFVDVIFNETVTLVPLTRGVMSSDTLLLGSSVIAAGVLLFAIMYNLGAGAGSAGEPSKGKAKEKATASVKNPQSGSQETSEWLQGTLAGSEGRAVARKKKKS